MATASPLRRRSSPWWRHGSGATSRWSSLPSTGEEGSNGRRTQSVAPSCAPRRCRTALVIYRDGGWWVRYALPMWPQAHSVSNTAPTPSSTSWTTVSFATFSTVTARASASRCKAASVCSLLLLVWATCAGGTPLPPPQPVQPALLSPPPLVEVVAAPPSPSPPDLLLGPPLVVAEALAALAGELLVTGIPLDPEEWQPPANDDEEPLLHETVDRATLFEWLMGGLMATGVAALLILPRRLGRKRRHRGSRRHRHRRAHTHQRSSEGSRGGHRHTLLRRHRHRRHHHATVSLGAGIDHHSSTR